jgi:hypothetical protein
MRRSLPTFEGMQRVINLNSLINSVCPNSAFV